MTRYISAADTNKLIRQELKKLWPKVEFRVHLTSGGRSANVEWWDGPTIEEVQQVTSNFEGESFDGMIDMASTRYGRDPKTGEQVHYGTNYVFEERYFTLDFLRPIAERIAKDYGLEMPKLEWSDTFGASVQHKWDVKISPSSTETLADFIHREARKISAVNKPAPHQPDERKPVATKVEGGWQIRHTHFWDADLFRQYKESLGFRWNKDDSKDRFWWCPVEKLPDDIQALVDELNTPDIVVLPKPQQEESPAVKLRELADSMESQIQAKLNPATANQRPTRRRAGIIASMEADGLALQQTQAALRKLADMWDAGTIPEILKGLRTRALVEALKPTDPPSLSWRTDDFTRLMKAGIGTPNKYHEARKLLLDELETKQESSIEQQVKAKKRDLPGIKIPGFFPTPADVVARMLQLADIQSGQRVLEPSAGWGNIADAIREAHPDVTLHCVEYATRLSDILKLKGHNVVDYNIMTYLVSKDEQYDRVVMNPPFEGNEDIQHIRRVQEHLKPGGRVVAIVSEHAFFGQEKTARDFRDWLEQVGATDEKIAEGAFLESERPTSVRCRIVVIDKPLPVINPVQVAREAYIQAAHSMDVNTLRIAAQNLRDALAASN